MLIRTVKSGGTNLFSIDVEHWASAAVYPDEAYFPSSPIMLGCIAPTRAAWQIFAASVDPARHFLFSAAQEGTSCRSRAYSFHKLKKEAVMRDLFDEPSRHYGLESSQPSHIDNVFAWMVGAVFLVALAAFIATMPLF